MQKFIPIFNYRINTSLSNENKNKKKNLCIFEICDFQTKTILVTIKAINISNVIGMYVSINSAF